MLLLRCLSLLSLLVYCFAVVRDIGSHPRVSQKQAESRLIHRLLKDYDPEVRPLTNLSDTIDVHVTFTPIRIDDLDLRSEVLKITGWVSMVWRDQFLQWDPRKEDNISCLLMHREDIWIPPLSVLNSMRGMFVSHDKTHYSKAQACWNGTLHYVIMENYVLSCDVDINFFPFDRQTCSIKVMSWYHPDRELRLRAQGQDMDQSQYEEDGEWALLNTQVNLTRYVSSGSHHLGDVDEVFSLVVFSLTMLRRPMYYVVNVLLPCVMLCVLVLINFFLPPDSGEKVSLGVTVLLAFTIFQLLIAETVPTSAVRTPKLAVFLLGIMATSTSSIIISVLVLDLHYRAVCSQPPVWLKRLVLDLLARVMCMRNSHMMHHVIQPLSPPGGGGGGGGDSQELPSSLATTAGTPACGDSLEKKSSGVDTKIRLTVEDEGSGNLGIASQLQTAASDLHVNLQTRKSDTDYRPLLVHRPHELGGSEHLLMSVTRPGEVNRAASSERELASGCQSLILGHRDSVHGILPLQTKSAQRLIQSINTLTTHAATGGGGGGGGAINEQKRSHSQQEFVRAVREVYHELRNSRRFTEWEHALVNEWKMIARVVDRLFFWITFITLLFTTIGVFTSLV